jgi:hypothetical protein
MLHLRMSGIMCFNYINACLEIKLINIHRK